MIMAMLRLQLLCAKHHPMHCTFVISFNPSQQPYDTATVGTLFYRREKREKESTVTGIRSLVRG